MKRMSQAGTSSQGNGPLRAAKTLDQKGASLVEYGLLVGLVAVVGIGAISGTGRKVSEVFQDITYEVRLAQQIATAEMVHYVPGTPRDEVFPAQSCFEGIPTAETRDEADAADCFLNTGGGSFSTGPDRDILMYLAGGGETVSVGQGNHWLVLGDGFSGTSTLTLGAGSSMLDLRPYSQSSVVFAPANSVDLDITLPGGQVEILGQISAQSVDRFVFADGEVGASGVASRMISDQIEAGRDTIEGSYMGDRFDLAADSDDVFVLPLEGDDVVNYQGGSITVFGDGNSGEDVLDMRPLTQGQVSYSSEWGGSALRITTPSGFVRLTLLAVNIERVIFADGEIGKAQLQSQM